MKKIVSFLIFWPCLAIAQPDLHVEKRVSGIEFSRGVSWQQIKTKAKSEDKYIFLDCYATWCGPCKAMDSLVYSEENVGSYINGHFLSVKVQLDSTNKDDEFVKAWYADAKDIIKEFKVEAFPTYLFFSPSGQIVHRGEGYANAKEFVKLAGDALDSTKGYYTLLRRYQQGRLEYRSLRDLANAASEFGDRSLALHLASDYMHNYLDRLTDVEFCTEENLRFMDNYPKMLTSKERVFYWYLKKSEFVDSVMKDGSYSKDHVNRIITAEEISPLISKKGGVEPNWKQIGKRIESKYGIAYVEMNILGGKVDWYKAVGNWRKYSNFLVKYLEVNKIENSPRDFNGMAYLNGSAMEVFKYSKNSKDLEKAIVWSDLAMDIVKKPSENAGNILDTKANLLYKLGRKNEALVLEQKALEMNPKSQELQDNLQKMQEGKATW